ncbi:MAG: hypothetical protein JWO31_3538, partial [Phycisphaerales bacterium]|nr:hypothetical protein [Phycisphaerales bacterium]
MAVVVGGAANTFPASALAQSPAAASAPPAPKRRPPVAPSDGKGFPAKPALEADLAALDDEVAAYLQFRGDVPADGASRLELLIDLRLIARWLLAAAVAERPDTDLQVAAVLRADELVATAVALPTQFKVSPKPTPAQADAMAKVHALSFKLPELKQVRQADDVCREVGQLLVSAAGPLPAADRQIPPMRPPAVLRPPPSTTPDRKPKRPAGPPAAPAGDPLARAAALTVAAPLKKQVLNVVTLGMSARTDAAIEADRKDAAAIAAVADRGLEMAEGLAQGTAVDAAARPQMERQLADGLALFADARTRDAGRRRLSALDDYAARLARVRRLNLPPELRQRLAPAFAYAGQHPDVAGKLLETVEGYLEACGRMDARAAATQPAALGQREAKAVAEAVKAAAKAREEFLADAAVMGQPGQRVDVAGLLAHADALRQALDAVDAYEKVPEAVRVLVTTRPRPAGALERRVATLTSALLDPRPSPGKDEAARALPELVRLADL